MFVGLRPAASSPTSSATSSFVPSARTPEYHQRAQPILFQADVEVNPVDPHVHEIAFRQVPAPERLVLLRVPDAVQHRQRLSRKSPVDNSRRYSSGSTSATCGDRRMYGGRIRLVNRSRSPSSSTRRSFTRGARTCIVPDPQVTIRDCARPLRTTSRRPSPSRASACASMLGVQPLPPTQRPTSVARPLGPTHPGSARRSGAFRRCLRAPGRVPSTLWKDTPPVSRPRSTTIRVYLPPGGAPRGSSSRVRPGRRFGCSSGGWSSSTGRTCRGRIPDFPVTRSHPPASWPSAANSSICRTYRKTAGEESRRRSPVANRWMRP